nr:DUF3265 domain-containing protein [Vibrio metschnikovii]
MQVGSIRTIVGWRIVIISLVTVNNLANKAFKRDSQRVAFLLCVSFCDYAVMR